VGTGPLDRDQIRRLYEQHARVLLAYGVTLLRDRAAAEDVLHQVFTKLLQGHVGINGTAVPYLYRAVRNAALNHKRNHSREVPLEPETAWLESPPGLEATGLALQAALDDLPEEQQAVVVLRVWGQMTFDEAAAALDISPNTAASRYRYALAKLRDKLVPMSKESP
jgi:RNA polymerase sigma-70 factor, ECF subfamily